MEPKIAFDALHRTRHRMGCPPVPLTAGQGDVECFGLELLLQLGVGDASRRAIEGGSMAA